MRRSMDLITLFLMGTGILAFLLILLVIMWAMMPSRHENFKDEGELDEIKHQVEMEGEREAEEELMPYKPPRLDAPRQRKRF